MTLVDIMRQMIEQALYSASISSAGGDSPKKNYVFDGTVNINPIDYEDILNNEMAGFMENKLPEVIEERGEEIKKSILESTELVGMMGMMRGGPLGLVNKLLAFGGPLIVAMLAPAMAEEVFKWLTRPGGWLDIRFKRVLEAETNAFLDRQTQWNTQIGLRQVTIQSIAGFRNINGIGNENTLRQVREGGANGNRLALIDFTDHSKGLFD
jgi:hypothetical protein